MGLLSRLFSKFDNLCELHGAYKVHTLCSTYVAIGYKGKMAWEKRSMEDAINEAFNMIQMA